MYAVVKGKHLLGALACCLALLIPVGIACVSAGSSPEAAETAAANTNWGLSFRENGKTPVGNATAEFLKQYNAHYVGDETKKVIYLTFDAGYENGYTPAILDALKKHNVKAAFFVVGNYIQTAPELVKRMVDEGHIVGNHTFHHPDMSKISDMTAFTEEIRSLETLYRETTGQDMKKSLGMWLKLHYACLKKRK